MVFITEELVRKRAEHNEGMVSTLEELSLHQLDIERIEHLDKWCRELKILYLQGNLISKIENVGRLKRLEYLNLALNNIFRIENLSGCESLGKLDLTLNFIKEVGSVANLRDNFNLEELYLTGNPCTQYTGYRFYIIATLPQLKSLDGQLISRLERTRASQDYEFICSSIKLQEEEALDADTTSTSEHQEDCVTSPEFWKQKTEHNPKTRRRLYEEMEKVRSDKEGVRNEVTKCQKPNRKLQTADGQILNINEPKVQFRFVEDEGCVLLLDVAVYKYLETAFIRVELQPTSVQIYISGKLLQLTLPEEVKPDDAVVQRSEATGHLLLRMPKATGCLGAVRQPPGIVGGGSAAHLNKQTSVSAETQRETDSAPTCGAGSCEDDDLPPLV